MPRYTQPKSLRFIYIASMAGNSHIPSVSRSYFTMVNFTHKTVTEFSEGKIVYHNYLVSINNREINYKRKSDTQNLAHT